MSRLARMTLTLAAVLTPTLLPAQTTTQTPTQTPAPSAPSPNLAGIAHVALRVHDLSASIAFYEKLGFVKAFELSRNGAVYEAFIKINDRQFIELYPADEKNPQIGFLHLCFEGADLPSVHDFYVSQGLTPNAVRTAGAGNLLFTMPGPATPQGPQNLEYTQYMPGSLHSKDFGLHLGTNRIATKMLSVTIAVDDQPSAHSFYLDKMGFLPSPYPTHQASLLLPGTSTTWIDLAPSKELAYNAQILFSADNDRAMQRTANDLKKQSIPFIKHKGFLTVLDPDSNEIRLQQTVTIAVD